MSNSVMTVKEAHAILHPDTTAASIWEIKMDVSNEAAMKAVKDACIVACEALEKQIEKKPVFEEATEKYEDGCWKCSVCSSMVGVFDLRDKYCSECGTKVDWSEK